MVSLSLAPYDINDHTHTPMPGLQDSHPGLPALACLILILPEGVFFEVPYVTQSYPSNSIFFSLFFQFIFCLCYSIFSLFFSMYILITFIYTQFTVQHNFHVSLYKDKIDTGKLGVLKLRIILC